MNREELRELVTKELGSTQLKLSERTINEELDDVLDDFGDNEEANAKLVSKLTNRLKRMDGNLHADVSKEVKEYKENAEKKRKEDGNGEKGKESGNDNDSEALKLVKELKSELDAERNARKQEQAERAKNATRESVRNGLKEKFEKAGLKLNSFFAKSALGKLDIPDENVDITSLIERAEKLYNADIKEAGVEIGKPHAGGNVGGKEEKEDWSDVSGIVGRYRPKTE